MKESIQKKRTCQPLKWTSAQKLLAVMREEAEKKKRFARDRLLLAVGFYINQSLAITCVGNLVAKIPGRFYVAASTQALCCAVHVFGFVFVCDGARDNHHTKLFGID